MTDKLRTGFIGIAEGAAARPAVIAGAYLAAQSDDTFAMDAYRAMIGDEELLDATLVAVWEASLSTSDFDEAAAAELLYQAAVPDGALVSAERSLARTIIRQAARTVEWNRQVHIDAERLRGVDMLSVCLIVFDRVCTACGIAPAAAAEAFRDSAPGHELRFAEAPGH